MKRLRLLAVIEAHTVTGPAKNLLQFAHSEAGSRGEIDLSVAAFRRAGDPEVFAEAAARVGIEVHRIEERGRFDRSVIGRLAALVREIRPDLVQTHAVKSHAIARSAGVDRMAPWVAFHHGYTWTDWRARAYNHLDRWSLRAAQRIITVSEPFRRELERIGISRERILVVHNAVAADWASAPSTGLKARLGIGAQENVVLIVGRLSREKDHATLLNAIARIPDAHLLIVGDGPERPRLEALVRTLSLAARVTFAGQAPSAEPFYAISDLAVLSSRTEGSPNALLEAMAARIPVVATAVGGIPEIVAHRDSALLIAPGDADAMAAAVSELFTDRALAQRLAGRARELVETRFTPEARASRLREIYRTLVENSRG